jgi:AcrR family transcriptional regulator
MLGAWFEKGYHMTSIEEPISNKEKILHAAIALFSEKGYAHVTMREIAAQVQIKAASIYNHYTGKEALLDAIVDYFRAQLHSEIYPRFATENNLDIKSFIDSVIMANTRFFTDPLFAKVSGIILREQFTNANVRELLLEELIQRPRDVFAAYFSRLMEAGKMTVADPHFVAKEFHAFFIYRFYENSLSLGGPPPDPVKAGEEHEAHIQFFLKGFCV